MEDHEVTVHTQYRVTSGTTRQAQTVVDNLMKYIHKNHPRSMAKSWTMDTVLENSPLPGRQDKFCVTVHTVYQIGAPRIRQARRIAKDHVKDLHTSCGLAIPPFWADRADATATKAAVEDDC